MVCACLTINVLIKMGLHWSVLVSYSDFQIQMIAMRTAIILHLENASHGEMSRKLLEKCDFNYLTKASFIVAPIDGPSMPDF